MLYLYEIIICLSWLVLMFYLIFNTRRIALLKDQPAALQLPPLAIVIAIRNEEANVQRALLSVCQLDYPHYRIIVVNDRSTDGTEVILCGLAAQYPQISIITISELPEKWLGKTHALYQGYLQAGEEWLLFTDADIVFDAKALRRAMHYTRKNQLDHLTVLPDVHSRSTALNAALTTFRLMLELKTRPWLAKSASSKAAIGIGAFNLIRKSTYEQIGTHRIIKLRPDDDLRLGKAVKEAGFRQDVLYGTAQVQLEWYDSINSFVNGLMKNMFATFDYQIFKALGGFIGTLLLFALPVPLALLAGDGTTRLLGILILCSQLVLCTLRGGGRSKWWFGLTLSPAGFLMAFIILKAMWLTLKNKGVYWRDSFYPLQLLKSNP